MTTRAFMFKIMLPTMVVVAFAYWFFAAPSGERTLRRFDSNRMACLELQMWKAYYAKERLRLFGLLVTMLHEPYRYSWAVATAEGFHLARAAVTSAKAKDHYERVLPDLTEGYSTAKNWLHAGFDPAAVARAEFPGGLLDGRKERTRQKCRQSDGRCVRLAL